jgi:hypothetical protein
MDFFHLPLKTDLFFSVLLEFNLLIDEEGNRKEGTVFSSFSPWSSTKVLVHWRNKWSKLLEQIMKFNPFANMETVTRLTKTNSVEPF